MFLALVACAWLPLGPAPASAHGVGTCQIHLEVDRPSIGGRWEIHLTDARSAIGLDPRVTGEAGWRELRGREPELRAFLARQFSMTADDAPCPVTLTSTPMEWERGFGLEMFAQR